MDDRDEKDSNQQRLSAVDKVNKTVNRARSAVKWAKRTRKAAQAARALVVFFGSGVGEIVLIILAVVLIIVIGAFLLIVIISIITGTNTSAGQICTTKTITTGGTGDIFSGNVDNYFSIRAELSRDEDLISKVKEFLTDPLSYSKYPSSLRIDRYGKIRIRITNNATCLGGGWACAYSESYARSLGYDIELTQSWVGARESTKKHYLIHETGHLINYRRSTTYDETFYNVGIRDGSKCYTTPGGPGIIRTYASAMSYLVRKTNESFAEAMADSVRCQVGEVCPGGYDDIRDFPTTCDKTYGWMINNVLGEKGGSITQTVTTCVAAPPPESVPTSTSCGLLTNPSEALFECLTKGQGRNVTALGSNVNDFIKNVKNNIGSRGWGLATNDAYLAKIYRASLLYNVNPVMLVVIWGVESSWRLNGTEFGVLYKRGEGFDSQLSGAVWILDNWMKVFNSKQTGGSLVYTNTKDGVTCTHTFYDKFAYSYNKYTPICPPLYGNNPTRKNFINFYKVLKGI